MEHINSKIGRKLGKRHEVLNAEYKINSTIDCASNRVVDFDTNNGRIICEIGEYIFIYILRCFGTKSTRFCIHVVYEIGIPQQNEVRRFNPFILGNSNLEFMWNSTGENE